MAVIVALNEYWNIGYRKTHSTIRSNKGLLERMGLDTIPSKSAIGRACRKVEDQYLHRLNDIVVRDIPPRSVAGDSTAHSTTADRRGSASGRAAGRPRRGGPSFTR